MSTYAGRIEFLSSGLESTAGIPLNGYQVRTYASDGSTPKVVWEDQEKTQPSASGKAEFSLDPTGRAVVYGDGVYVIKIWTSTADPDVDSPYKTYPAAQYLSSILSLGFTNYAELREESGSIDGTQAIVSYKSTLGDEGGGKFYWDSSDLSTEVTADALSNTYVAPTSDLTGASGAWVRQGFAVAGSLMGYRDDDAFEYAGFRFDAGEQVKNSSGVDTKRNYIGALGDSKLPIKTCIGAEGSINTYQLLVSRIDYEETVTAGAFIVGNTYEIASVGTTDFTLIGSADNIVGTQFTATGAGSGTGTAKNKSDLSNRLMEIAADGDHSSTIQGPIIDLIRGGNPSNRLTTGVNLPAAGNLLGVIRFTGRNTDYDAIRYAGIHAFLNDPTPASEDGSLFFKTSLSGTYDTRFKLARGFYSDGLVDPGDGNANFSNLFIADAPFVWETSSPTLTIKDASGNTASTATIVARYQRVGDMATLTMTAPNIDTSGLVGTDELRIYGLPDSVDSAISSAGTVILHGFSTFSASYTSWSCRAEAGASYLVLKQTGSGQADKEVLVSEVDAATSDIENLTITYKV